MESSNRAGRWELAKDLAFAVAVWTAGALVLAAIGYLSFLGARILFHLFLDMFPPPFLTAAPQIFALLTGGHQ